MFFHGPKGNWTEMDFGGCWSPEDCRRPNFNSNMRAVFKENDWIHNTFGRENVRFDCKLACRSATPKRSSKHSPRDGFTHDIHSSNMINTWYTVACQSQFKTKGLARDQVLELEYGFLYITNARRIGVFWRANNIEHSGQRRELHKNKNQIT